MSTSRTRRRVVSLVGAIVMLLPVSLAMAHARGDQIRPIEITFTKWVTAFPLMEGFWGGDPANQYVGEVLQRQVSVNPALNSIVRLEAIYEIQDGDHSFTALIRGGTNNVTGAARLDGVVRLGGAPVQPCTWSSTPYPARLAAWVRQLARRASWGRFRSGAPHATQPSVWSSRCRVDAGRERTGRCRLGGRAPDGALRQADESTLRRRGGGDGVPGTWGDAQADRNQFAPLLDRAAGGLATGVLAKAIEDRGWRTVRFTGSIESVADLLRDGRPVIVLLKVRNGRFHYVVVVGTTDKHIVVHDPARGPSRSVPVRKFLDAWEPAGFWALLVLPGPPRG